MSHQGGHQHNHTHGDHHDKEHCKEHEHHHEPKMEGSDKKWEDEHPNYASIDSAPQTFFYTITNMLKLNEAKNILQVGCGAGKLLSTVLDLKNPEASYYATDLSEAMVKQAKHRLQSHFTKYKSKQTFEEWLESQHMNFGVQNGEKIQLKEDIKFDRIIANMVLCHANDPQKMLKNWHQISTEDCLLGVSLLGNPPEKNNFVIQMRQAIEESGQKLPDTRPPYYWYDKISKIVQQTGWQIILEWDQNALFPILSTQSPDLKQMIEKKIPKGAQEGYSKKLDKLMNVDKNGIQFWSKIIIARKIKK